MGVHREAKRAFPMAIGPALISLALIDSHICK